jgi:hypothetical protein
MDAMAESFNEATFGFRFMSLSDHELQRLRELLPKVTFTSRLGGSGFVVSFDLTKGVDLDSLCAFIDESGTDPRNYSVWISVIASSDQGGIELPAHVLAAIRRTSGGVDFSFASCLGEPSNEPAKAVG